MKQVLIVLALIAVVESHAAEITTSEIKLRECLSLVYSKGAAFKGLSKDMTKMVSVGVRDCRHLVKGEVKRERDTKKRLKLESQIAKLQSKLKGE